MRTRTAATSCQHSPARAARLCGGLRLDRVIERPAVFGEQKGTARAQRRATTGVAAANGDDHPPWGANDLADLETCDGGPTLDGSAPLVRVSACSSRR